MTAAEPKLPYLTFAHRPCRGYILRGEGDVHTVVSPVFESPVDFASLVLCVSYRAKSGGWLMTEAQIRQHGVWSKFFKLALYSPTVNHSFDEQEDAAARLSVDVLKSKKPAQAYRFRLTLYGDLDVPSVTVCLSAWDREYDACAGILPCGVRKIAVKPVSQMRLDVSETDQRRLCSPSSLCMALNALGVRADPLETAAAVYDDRARIYGNWTLNTAYACTRGLSACVTRFQRLAQLADFVTENSLVAASVAYERGELAGAAVARTPGHLVLVCGWKDGKVRVADPAAAQTRDVIRFYDAQEFARAWLENKRGAAYLVRKP